MLTKSKVQGLQSVKYIGTMRNFSFCFQIIHICNMIHDNGSKNIPTSYDSVARCTLFCISRSAWFPISNATISAWPCWLANISGDKSLWMEVSWMQTPHAAPLAIRMEYVYPDPFWMLLVQEHLIQERSCLWYEQCMFTWNAWKWSQ